MFQSRLVSSRWCGGEGGGGGGVRIDETFLFPWDISIGMGSREPAKKGPLHRKTCSIVYAVTYCKQCLRRRMEYILWNFPLCRCIVKITHFIGYLEMRNFVCLRSTFSRSAYCDVIKIVNHESTIIDENVTRMYYIVYNTVLCTQIPRSDLPVAVSDNTMFRIVLGLPRSSNHILAFISCNNAHFSRTNIISKIARD